jgi:hypothetical protein
LKEFKGKKELGETLKLKYVSKESGGPRGKFVIVGQLSQREQ